MDEFDYIVLGDEPAGLWLVAQLSEIGQILPPVPRIAWISTAECREGAPLIPEVAVPFPLAGHLGISTEERWSPEIVTPRASLVWRERDLQAAFPELPDSLFGPERLKALLKPSDKTLSAIRYAVRTRPELLAYASGLWKYLGRTPRMQPESTVVGALACTELSWWSPWRSLPQGAEKVFLNERENPLEEVSQSQSGGLCLRFRGLKPVAGKRVILNCPVLQLERLGRYCHGILDRIRWYPEQIPTQSLYPLRLRVEAETIPRPVRPLTVWLDTIDIPDPDREMWPFDWRLGALGQEKELRLWVSMPSALALEATLDRFREGMSRLYRLFPFLATRLLSVEPSLNLSECASSEARESAILELERQGRERYLLTSLSTETRDSALISLFPSLHCELPYPLGPLRLAARLRDDIRNRLKRHKPKSAPILSK